MFLPRLAKLAGLDKISATESKKIVTEHLTIYVCILWSGLELLFVTEYFLIEEMHCLYKWEEKETDRLNKAKGSWKLWKYLHKEKGRIWAIFMWQTP